MTTPEKCNATIEFADIHSDNSTVFVCQKPKGHKGQHEIKAITSFNNIDITQKFTLTWTKNSKSETEGAYDEHDAEKI